MSPTPDPDLMRIFGFTVDDLEANRAGYMSEKQAKYFKDESDADRFAVGCAIRVALFVMVLLAFGYILRPPQSISLNVLSGIIVIVGVLFWLYLRYRSSQNAVKSDLQTRRVGKIEGTLTWQVITRQKEYVYQITIDGKVFRVEKQAYKALDEFMHLRNKYVVFRIYFAPETVKILSVEVISQ